MSAAPGSHAASHVGRNGHGASKDALSSDDITGSESRKSFHRRLSEHFCIEERGSSVGKEIRAGVVTFLTMSYILLVNPQILAHAGFPPDQVVVATALSSGVACVTVGALGNLPFGLAPGTGRRGWLPASCRAC
ncbi:xanthine uracil vitamin c permease [Nannochloropsis gaditana]|uniref:Xanthine uracil vitamin c permease n=1 Tax=Nannochloropsis gaditana TaxID=72520 RepID=W7T071_9STRA|nr:xanthine uracil vitamin c permease [Nannochloropsis gaditana]